MLELVWTMDRRAFEWVGHRIDDRIIMKMIAQGQIVNLGTIICRRITKQPQVSITIFTIRNDYKKLINPNSVTETQFVTTSSDPFQSILQPENFWNIGISVEKDHWGPILFTRNHFRQQFSVNLFYKFPEISLLMFCIVDKSMLWPFSAALMIPINILFCFLYGSIVLLISAFFGCRLYVFGFSIIAMDSAEVGGCRRKSGFYRPFKLWN